MTDRVSLYAYLQSQHPHASTLLDYLYGTEANPLPRSRLETFLMNRVGQGDVLMELEYIEARIGKKLFTFDSTKSQGSIVPFFLTAVAWLHLDYLRSKNGQAARKTVSLDLDAHDDDAHVDIPDCLRGGLTGGSAEADRRETGQTLAHIVLKQDSVPDAVEYLRNAGIFDDSGILKAYKLCRGLVHDNRVAPLTESMIKRASSVLLDGESVNDVAARESVAASAISRSVTCARNRIGDAARVAGFH